MKVAMLFDGVSALGPSADLLIIETVEAVEASLEQLGHAIVRIPVNPDGRWIERVRRGKFDVAFNLCEGIDGTAEYETPVISVLELLAVPYTGASSLTTALCLRKYIVNTLAERHGVPVPAWAVSKPGAPVPAVGFPAICKPAAEDASVGVEQRSVARSARSLSGRLRDMHTLWDEVLVQRYVDGREINVGVLGDEVLPIAEIEFGTLPSGMWRIVSYNAKWSTGSEEDTGTKPRCPADLSPALAEEIRSIALAAWRAVGGDGYGRVDLRIDEAGRPWLLEVNANPDIAPDAGLARMARVAGMDYTALVERMVELAMARRPMLQPDRWAETQRLSGVIPEGGARSGARVAVGDR